MKRNLWSLIMMWTGLVILAGSPNTLAYEIEKCDATAEGDVKIAAQYIEDNLEEIVATFAHTQLTQDHRDEFIRKWPRAKIVCRDEGSKGVARECAVSTGLGGMAHGGLGNKINICYYNKLEINETLCDMVKTLAHEFGHANGYPISSVHNDFTNPARFNDAVYTLGSQARTFCANDANFNDRPLRGTASLALGDSCESDDQCLSGKCKKDQCICDQDSDCPTGESCFKPLTKLNYCSRTDNGLGVACSKNEQCRSGKCQNDECVCKTDSDCPGAQSCFTPAFAPNYCQPTTKALGANCAKNEECQSDKCEDNHCVCKADSDCPVGQSCFTPVTAPNYCQSTTKALGANCAKNEECQSDKCEGNRCVCKSDSDCPGGQSCYTPVTGPNYCESTSKDLGVSCSKNSQCRSDNCQGGECVCKKDSDCPNRQKCKKPVIGSNHCE